MPSSAPQTTIRIRPGVFRVLAVMCCLGGLALVFRDAEVMAERRLALTGPVPAALPLTDEALARRGVAVEAAILAETPGSQEVFYRRGIAQRTAIAFPLVDPESGVARGYAVLPPTLAGRDAAEAAMAAGVWTGLRNVPPTLDIAVRQAFDLAPGAVGLVLYDAPREEVLARPNRSPWRAVLFWLAAFCLVGGHILAVEQTRLAVEQKRRRVTRGWPPKAPAFAAPLSEKARMRFARIAADDEMASDSTDPAAETAQSGLARLRRLFAARRGETESRSSDRLL